MLYKTTYCKNALFQEKLAQVFQRPYPFNTRANLKNLGTFLFLRAQGIRKSFYRLCILMCSFETCVCLRMVENLKFFSVLAKENSFILQYAAMFDKRNI